MGGDRAGTSQAIGVETCRQSNGLANGRAGEHKRGMEKYRSRMLEVTVTNRPPKWEWEVSSGGEMVANGFEGEQTRPDSRATTPCFTCSPLAGIPDTKR
jgi:hypothetical protein